MPLGAESNGPALRRHQAVINLHSTGDVDDKLSVFSDVFEESRQESSLLERQGI